MRLYGCVANATRSLRVLALPVRILLGATGKGASSATAELDCALWPVGTLSVGTGPAVASIREFRGPVARAQPEAALCWGLTRVPLRCCLVVEEHGEVVPGLLI